MSTGVLFNGKHSFRDFGLTIEKKEIGYPSKNKITEKIPFMNGTYDFSTALTDGEDTYSERPISITFNLIMDKYKNKSTDERRKLLYQKADLLQSWLLDTNGRKSLILDENLNYYYEAEVVNAPSLEDIVGNGKLKVEFICYPFKRAINITTYNFGYYSGTKSYTVKNNGRPVTPNVKCSNGGFVIEINNKVFRLVEGEQTVWGARLLAGNNTVIVSGTGTVELKFREETL